jgi:fatty-acyl-CoA synthase
MMEGVSVVDPETMQPVPDDGNTMGEVMIKGNIVMKGYFKNPTATQEAFAGGWFHTGDLAVSHGNGRFEIKDRSKGSPAAVHIHISQCDTHPVTSPGAADIIISGGENISSIEVQNILMTHPGVLEVAVVAMPDEKWGEVPCAFVARNPQASPQVSEAELIEWARGKMPRFQAPKRIIFGDIPKTSTGKVQKNVLKTLL